MVSIMGAGRFLEQGVDVFEKSMQLDYFGSLYLAKSVLPGMVQRNAGQLLFIASPLAAIGKAPCKIDELHSAPNLGVFSACNKSHHTRLWLSY